MGSPTPPTTCRTPPAPSPSPPVPTSTSATPPSSTTPTPLPVLTSPARSAPSSPGTTRSSTSPPGTPPRTSTSPTPPGESVTKTMIMFPNNHAGEMNNFAIGNYGASVTVQMNVACNNVESHAAEVTMVDTTTCSFVLDVTDSRAALLVFSADTQSNVDFFAVSVQ